MSIVNMDRVTLTPVPVVVCRGSSTQSLVLEVRDVEIPLSGSLRECGAKGLEPS